MNKGTPLLFSLRLQLLLLLLLLLSCSREFPCPLINNAVHAFAPPRIPITRTRRRRHTRSSTTTTLFGLRTKAKEKIAAILTRKLPRIVQGRNRRQSVDLIDKPDDEDEDGAVLQGTTPSSADIVANPIGLEVETTSPYSPQQQYSDIVAVEGFEKSEESQIDEAEQNHHEDEKRDPIQSLPSKTTSLVHLPPLSRYQQEQLTRAQLEFRNHFVRFERYSQRDVALLKSPRLHIVLSGLAATPLEPAVYQSLEILYQDLMPLRYAGRFIFRRLENVLEMCVQARHDELQLIRSNTTTSHPSIAALEVAQLAFSEWVTKLCCCENGLSRQHQQQQQQVDSHGDMENNKDEHDLVLSTSRLLQSSSCSSALTDAFDIIKNSSSSSSSSSSSNPNDIQRLAALLDSQETGAITFPQFVYGLQQLCHENDAKIFLDDDVLNQVSRNILIHVAAAPKRKDVAADAASHGGGLITQKGRLLDPARRAYSERFDEMLAAIREWQTLLFFNENHASPSASNHNNDGDRRRFGGGDDDGDDDGDGENNEDSLHKLSRRWQVLQGCCVGAENAAVREALRICYVDNAASRISGNIIFALVSALMPKPKQ